MRMVSVAIKKIHARGLEVFEETVDFPRIGIGVDDGQQSSEEPVCIRVIPQLANAGENALERPVALVVQAVTIVYRLRTVRMLTPKLTWCSEHASRISSEIRIPLV